MSSLRDLPSVEEILKRATNLIDTYGRSLTLQAIRLTLDEARARFQLDPETVLPSTNVVLAQAESQLSAWSRPTLQPVINATGVILHTNLGRAPLSDATLRAMDEVSRNYSNLEYDLPKGQRGTRLFHAESLLQKLTGAEAAVEIGRASCRERV